MSPGSEEGNERKTTSKFNFSLPGFSPTDSKNLGTSLQENHDFITHRACLVTSVNACLLKDQLERETEQWCIAKKKPQGILFLTRPSFHNHRLYGHHHRHRYIHCYSQYHQQITVHHQESHLLSLSARKKVWEKVARDFSSNSEVMSGFGIHSDGGENLDFLTGFNIYSDWWKIVAECFRESQSHYQFRFGCWKLSEIFQPIKRVSIAILSRGRPLKRDASFWIFIGK